MKNKQIWAFDEPGPYGGNAHITMTEEEIIKHMRTKEAYMGRPYSDQTLLDQFVVINWAYKEKNEEEKAEELDYSKQPHPNW